MFYCVYIGNSKVSNTARDVHCGVKHHMFKIADFHWLFTIEDYLTIRPVARKGYGAIAHEAKPNGLLIRGP